MPADPALLAEAQRRGLIPASPPPPSTPTPTPAAPSAQRQPDPALLAEAQRRGLVPPVPPSPPATPPRPAGYSDIAGATGNLLKGFSLSSNEELTGALATILNVPNMVTHARPDQYGEAASETFHDAAQKVRDTEEYFLSQHPNAGNFLQGTGSVAPVVAAMATGQPELLGGRASSTAAPGISGAIQRAATGKGPLALLARMLRGGVTGATVGSVAGFNAGDGDVSQRLASAGPGAGWGAAFGTAAPAAISGLKFPASVISQLMDRPSSPRAVPGAPTAPTPTPQEQIPPAAVNRIDALTNRVRGMTPDTVGAALGAARDNPQGQRLVDIFRDPGVRMLRPIAQAPGESGEMVAEAAQQRFAEAPARIGNALMEGLGVGESAPAALRRLRTQYSDLSRDAYVPLWNRQMSAESRQAYNERIAPMLSNKNPNLEERRIMQQAQREARRQFDLDRANRRVQGTWDENLPRALHYIKMQLGDMADFEAQTHLSGASGQRIGGMRQMYQRFGRALDYGSPGSQVIPGYRTITDQAGDFFTGREALEQGKAFATMRPEEVQQALSEMSDFQRFHARIGLADEIRHSTRGRVDRNINVANVMSDPDVRGVVAAAFENPEQAADFLSMVSTQGRLMRNAAGWGGGSTSFSNFAHGIDNTSSIIDTLGDVARGDHGRATMRIARQLGNLFSNNAIERANNQVGSTLLRRVDTPDSEAFANQVVQALQQRQMDRSLSNLASQGAAGASGIAAGNRRPSAVDQAISGGP